jgi:phage shock protein PspC (stress-responsive transcriptional regulator)
MPPTSSSLGDEKHVPSLLLSTAARDPVLIAPLAVARSASEAINFGVAYRLSTGVAGTVGHMTTQYVVPPEKVRIGAGTALKFGFFAAFGIFLFYLILSVILGTVAILLASAGAFNINNLLPG